MRSWRSADISETLVPSGEIATFRTTVGGVIGEWLALEGLNVQPKRLARLAGKREQSFAVGKISGPLILESRRREVDRFSVTERHQSEVGAIPSAERQGVLTVRREAHPKSVAELPCRIVI